MIIQSGSKRPFLSVMVLICANLSLLLFNSTANAGALWTDSKSIITNIFDQSTRHGTIKNYPLITQFNRRKLLKSETIELYFGSADLCTFSQHGSKTESMGSRYQVNMFPIFQFVRPHYVILRAQDGKFISRDGDVIPLRNPKVIATKRLSTGPLYLVQINQAVGSDRFMVLDFLRCK